MANKLIEQIAEDFKSYLPTAWYNDKNVYGEVYSMARQAFMDGYHKDPENSIMITKAEYDDLIECKRQLGCYIEDQAILLTKIDSLKKPKNTYVPLKKCSCGAKRSVRMLYSVYGDRYKCIKCGLEGDPANTIKRGGMRQARLNWNKAVEESEARIKESVFGES